MRDNFERCLAEVLKHEGGWADHPKDPGGATMKGITIGTYAQWKGRKVTKDELRRIPDAEVAAIYRRNYWDKVRGDDLPAGLDLVAFDAAVNSGPARGARWLQEALGVTADGKIGPATLEAARNDRAPTVIERAIARRLAFLRGLKTWPTFGKGWGRRVEDVRSKALAMAAAPATVPAPQPTPTPGLFAAILRALAALFRKGKQ
jgi:lysozyme family protein